jgi:hypothetical protein
MVLSLTIFTRTWRKAEVVTFAGMAEVVTFAGMAEER